MLKFVTPVAALAAALLTLPSSGGAQSVSGSSHFDAATIELAAAQNQKGGGGNKSHAAKGGGGQRHGNAAKGGGGQKHAHTPKGGGGQKHVNKGGKQKQAHTPKHQGGQNAQGGNKQKGGTKQAHKPLPNGPGKKKLAGGKHLKHGPGKNITIVDRWHGWARPAHVNIYRGSRRIWIADGWRVFVPIAAIGVWAWGVDTLWADGYVPIAANACYGPTGDGCRLRWQEVDLVGGGTEFQCVQYCKQRGRSVAEVDLPADETTGSSQVSAPQDNSQALQSQARACDMMIFENANFQGLSAENQEDQPTLTDDGWKDQISSIQIKAGTWDFFTDANYAGDMMRLKAGDYAKLDPAWTKKIGSFMCNTNVASR